MIFNLYRVILSLVSSAVLSLAYSGAIYCQEFPTKPIRLIVPFSAGDIADSIARLLSSQLTGLLGQSIIVENKPGASGLLGLQSALQAEPDGYTIVLGQMGGMAIAPHVNSQSFDIRKEFIAVSPAFSNYMLLVVNPSIPANTLEELITYSKRHPNELKLGTNGEGGFPHLAMELIREQSDLTYTHIPYKGASQIPIDLIAGRIDMTILGYSNIIQHVNSGKLKAIAVTSPNRPINSPQIPSIGETIKGYAALGWFGFFARTGTPPAAIKRINDAVNIALRSPEVIVGARTLDIDPQLGTSKVLSDMWIRDFDRWGRLVQTIQIEK
jgi:tripartite-type tricarboxylate transporter receptor subunit TctC